VRLHVAVINQHPDDVVGGSELQCDLIARGLVARGHTVSYLAVHASAALERSSRDAGSRPYAVIPLGRSASSDAAEIVAAVRDCGADVVYWRMNRGGLAEVARLLADGPHAVPVTFAVAHVDDVTRWPSAPPEVLRPRALVADLRQRVGHRRSWRAFDDVAAVAAQRQDFLARVPVALQRYVPNGVDPTVVPFTWPGPYVAWVANLKPRKRPEQLIPIARALAPHGVDLVVVGGVQDARYDALSRHDPAVANLHPLGLLPQAETSGVIAGARSLAVTTRPEGLSNAMLQAWWHGVPTVSLDYDPDGLVAGEGLGAACEGDVGRFLREVVRHATDDEVRRAVGRRAATLAHERFTLERSFTALELLLLDVVRAHRAHSATGPA